MSNKKNKKVLIMAQIQNFGFKSLSELLGISDKIIQLFSNHLF